MPCREPCARVTKPRAPPYLRPSPRSFFSGRHAAPERCLSGHTLRPPESSGPGAPAARAPAQGRASAARGRAAPGPPSAEASPRARPGSAPPESGCLPLGTKDAAPQAVTAAAPAPRTWGHRGAPADPALPPGAANGGGGGCDSRADEGRGGGSPALPSSGRKRQDPGRPPVCANRAAASVSAPLRGAVAAAGAVGFENSPPPSFSSPPAAHPSPPPPPPLTASGSEFSARGLPLAAPPHVTRARHETQPGTRRRER